MTTEEFKAIHNKALSELLDLMVLVDKQAKEKGYVPSALAEAYEIKWNYLLDLEKQMGYVHTIAKKDNGVAQLTNGKPVLQVIEGGKK